MALFKKKPKKTDGETPAEDEPADAAAPAPEGGAEGEGEGGEGDEAPKKKGPPLKLMIIAAAAVLVLGGGGTGAFLMFGPKAAPSADGHKAKPKKEKKKGHGGGAEAGKAGDKNAPQISDGPDGVVFYTLPDLLVNLQTADGKPTFLKLKLTLELPNSEALEVLEPNRPRMDDMFQTFLRELRPEDLSGSQGSYQLRMEILRRVNLVIAPARIKAVLIEEMLIN